MALPHADPSTHKSSHPWFAIRVRSNHERTAAAHLRQRGMIVDVEHPQAGTFTMPGCPLQLSDSPVEVRPAPLLGDATDDVLERLLSIDAATRADLRARGII